MKKTAIQISFILSTILFFCPGYAANITSGSNSTNSVAQTTDPENSKQEIMGKCVQEMGGNAIQISDASDCKKKHTEKDQTKQG